MLRLTRICLVASVAGVLAACGGEIGALGTEQPVGSNQGRVQLQLTGSQMSAGNLVQGQPSAGPDGQVKQVNVTITRVTAHSNTAGWVELFKGPSQLVDLLDLKNSAVTLGFKDLPAGKVTQIRLYTEENGVQNVVLKDGSTVDLKVPSGVQSGIKVHGPFEVRKCEKVTLSLGFVGHKSIWVHPTGQGDLWILRPVIHSSLEEHQPVNCQTPGGAGGGTGSIPGTGGGSGGTTPGSGGGFGEIPGSGGGTGSTGAGGGTGTVPGTGGGSGSTTPGTGGSGGGSTGLPGTGGGSGSSNPSTPGLIETGGNCGLGTQCLSGVCINGVCGAGASGAPCTVNTGCISGVCMYNSCTAPSGAGGTGSACALNSECLSGSCINSVCDPGATGQPCRATSDCTGGLSCVSGTCVVPIN